MYVLVTVLHDPEARLQALVDRHLGALLDPYEGAACVVTPETAPQVAKALADAGVRVIADAPEASVGGRRRAALRAGLALGATHLHYCDLDRALHWAATYPAELASLRARVEAADYLVLGRTERAFATHPRVQFECERLTNSALSAALGRPVDATAGSCGLSARAAAWLVNLSLAPTNATDTEWPVLVQTAPLAFRLDFCACEGLEFETPDQYPDEIARAGSLEAWLAERSRPYAAWLERARLAWDSIAIIQDVLSRPHVRMRHQK